MNNSGGDARERLSPPIEIQRPSSALHAGDFTHDSTGPTSQPSIPSGRVQSYGKSTEPLGTLPTTPWYTPRSSFHGHQPSPPPYVSGAPSVLPLGTPLRSRAPSTGSYSSNYILKAPTSPLVQQSNNTDLDFSPADLSPTSDRINRRHTLPPHTLLATQMAMDGPSTLSHDTQPMPAHPRDGSLPHQRHHARRSLTSNWSLQVSTSPQTPGVLRARRTSYSEMSPLQNASMVGSFEESILRGSMSTAPSKPLDFTAQIGVLGKGDCKPKCPAHVVIPFPAVFYSWGGSVGTDQRLGEGEPSPYVGHIDLQSSLPPPERRGDKESSPRLKRDVAQGSKDVNLTSDGDPPNPDTATKKTKKRRRSPTPHMTPLGGSYRIPQQGQLQIIIKNPNKTAVKLFLVPYDLTGMEPETKTFVRQRCYSTESVDDSLIASPRASSPGPSSRLDEVKKKPTLRYLIHLNICSPSSGRFYLYQHIRVVFANRVPDNKEMLQNEIQVPQPRFSPYRPTHDIVFGIGASSHARTTNEKAFRRRSAGYDAYSHLGSDFSMHTSIPTPPIPPIPCALTGLAERPSQTDLGHGHRPTRIEDQELMDMSHVQCSPSSRLSPGPLSSSFRSSSSNGSEGYEKLNRGDSGYGGLFLGRDGAPIEGGEGLLARKLKGLGVRGINRVDTNNLDGGDVLG